MKPSKENRNIPPWLKILLMGLLIAMAGWAFYRNSLDVMERLTQ